MAGCVGCLWQLSFGGGTGIKEICAADAWRAADTAVNVTEWIHGLSKVGTGRMRMHGLSLQFVKEGLGEKPICSGSDTGGWAFFA